VAKIERMQMEIMAWYKFRTDRSLSRNARSV